MTDLQAATGRSVTLIVCGSDGDVLGSIGPFSVATPWWQDTEPIQERFPQVTVLRLLGGTPARPGPAGGEVRYLAELSEAAPSPGPRRLDLRPATLDEAVLEDHPLRMPWARAGGPGAVLAWATAAAEQAGWAIKGPAVQHRTWNLSAIWSFPAASPSGSGQRLWLKCLPPFFAHEPAVLRLLRGESVPIVIAASGQAMLLAAMLGRDGFGASLEETKQISDRLVALQLRTRGLVATLLSVGVTDSRDGPLLEELRSVVRRRAPDEAVLRQLLDGAGERLALARSCGLPDVLVHGDAHPGNARLGAGEPVLFDWGDCRIGNPVLDLDVLDRLDDASADAVAEHWLGRLAAGVPESDPPRAWQLLRPLAALRAAAVYQGFLDKVEPSERIYHEADVSPALARAARLALGERRGEERRGDVKG